MYMCVAASFSFYFVHSRRRKKNDGAEFILDSEKRDAYLNDAMMNKKATYSLTQRYTWKNEKKTQEEEENEKEEGW